MTFDDISTEFIASVVTGSAIFAGKWAWRRWTNFRIERQHPLEGDYISYYGDFDAKQNEFTRKAHLRIIQDGKEFTATNTNLDDGRKWDLRGNILTHGYLAGTYGRLDPNDPSKGTFFMEPDVSTPGLYTGHWSGYDSVNRRLASAQYYWRRIKKVRVRQLGKSDEKLIDQITAVFAESLGSRFIARERVAEILSKNTNRFLLGGFLGKELVAVRTVYILNDAEVSAFQDDCRKAGVNLNLADYKVGMLASNAVRPDFRRKGIGAQMVEGGLSILKKKGCTTCIATAWESESVESSAKLLEAFGFSQIAKSENHWKDDSIEKNYDCPKCGSPPCSCSAHFYRKQL